MKNLTIIRLMPFEKPDTNHNPNHFRTHHVLLKNLQQISFTSENIIKTNFMVL